MKECPYCKRPNDDNATICAHCKAAIPHEGKTEDSEEDESDSNRTSRRKLRS